MSELNERTAIVTGGSRGIGKEVTRELAERGSDVVITGRTQSDLEETVDGFSDLAGDVFPFQSDVRELDDCKKTIRKANEEFGCPDILVNNAGIGQTRTEVESLDPEEWNDVIDTNLTGCFYMSREVIPGMKENGGGDIVFISSLAGRNAVPSYAAYGASKWGLVGFAKSLMLEVRQDNIKVGTICPGSVETGFTDEDKSDWALYPEDVAKVVTDFLTHRRDSLTSLIEMRPRAPKND